MAAIFGELQLPSSRAYDEDESDEETETTATSYEVDVQLSKEAEEKLVGAAAFLVSYGCLATDFCKAFVSSQSSVNIGKVTVGENGDVDSRVFLPRLPQASPLFITPSGLLVCCNSSELPAAAATQFSKKLLSLMKCSKPVVVLSSHHAAALRGNYSPKEGEHCVVHSLHSPAYLSSPVYQSLPQPATLDSLPAAVLLESLAEERQCVLYPVYTETCGSADLDLVVEAVMPVLRSEPLAKLVPANLSSSSLLQLKPFSAQKDLLDRYM